MRLLNIGALVSAQENSCRYCYGTNRAFMRILGYSEAFISRIEQDAQVAELDAKERAFIAFCRHLARSRPRPAKADRDALVALGYSPLEVNEMALVIASCCFYNRMSTLVASPPEQALERMAGGTLGRLLNLVGPLIRNLIMRPRTPIRDPMDPAALSKGPYGPVVATLAGLPGATLFRAALDGAFASDVLPRSTKALMFAVVARALACRPSEDESRKLLLADGFDHAEIESALSTFASARLSPRDAKILTWVRETVAYRPEAIQDETRALAEEIGEAAILEAIGVAALANAIVRLGMLLE